MGLWSSKLCRYCGTYKDTDTFYVFSCKNESITLEREEVFDSEYNLLRKCNIEDPTKELILQVLINNMDYQLPLELEDIF